MSVNVINIGELAWQEVPDSWSGKAHEGEPGVRFKPFQVCSGGGPTGQLIEYEAGHVEDPHSHEEDEIFYMLDGDLGIGEVLVSSGMLVHIERDTIYGPLKTKRGCRFLRIGLSS